ncbi:MAG: hypothetical protein E6I76_19725 [Chloroflexi bacterium]|nr:MAG: hypothetical protein E6I76_19725 [Chloroflexota bacterium]
MKALSRRLNVVGYSTIYLDPKGETTPLARAFGVEPLRLTTGGDLRLNPLDEKLASATGLDPTRERELLMRAVLPVMLERPLRPAELRIVSEVVRAVVESCTQPTLRDVHAGLAAHGEVTADPADALWDYIHGPAGALFDAPTSAGVDLDAPLLALNLRRLTQTLTAEKQRLVTLALAAAWLFAIVSRRRSCSATAPPRSGSRRSGSSAAPPRPRTSPSSTGSATSRPPTAPWRASAGCSPTVPPR